MSGTRPMAEITSRDTEREAQLRTLAERLEFRMDGANGRYTLTRTVDLRRLLWPLTIKNPADAARLG